MNLQENIQRIKELIILNEVNYDNPQEIVKNNVVRILNTLKSDAKRETKGVINVSSAIDKFQSYLISRIPEILEKSKTGNGGEQFAYECYKKVSEILTEELNSISGIKKFALSTLAPKKEKFIQKSLNPNLYDIYFYFFEQLVDFPYQVGFLPQFEKVSDNMAQFSTQTSNYVDRNRNKIINSFVNQVANFLYS